MLVLAELIAESRNPYPSDGSVHTLATGDAACDGDATEDASGSSVTPATSALAIDMRSDNADFMLETFAIVGLRN
jgi:hypothetical protein